MRSGDASFVLCFKFAQSSFSLFEFLSTLYSVKLFFFFLRLNTGRVDIIRDCEWLLGV
jgi:hypothetical protein